MGRKVQPARRGTFHYRTLNAQVFWLVPVEVPEPVTQGNHLGYLPGFDGAGFLFASAASVARSSGSAEIGAPVACTIHWSGVTAP